MYDLPMSPHLPIGQTAWLARPRIYPMPFARRLVDLLEPMKETAKGCPVAPVPTPKAVDTFNQWPEINPDDWSFADFGEMFVYLRGNRHLIIPEEWRGKIPDRL